MALTKYLNRSISDTSKEVIKRVCMLKPIKPEHQTIQLEVGQNIIGRSKETGIRDTRCSKKQLQLEVNPQQCSIKLEVLGLNPCGVNGVMAMQNTVCELCHGDIIEIVYGRHPFEVVFKPPPELAPEKNDKHNSTSEENWVSLYNGKLIVFSSSGLSASEKIAGYDIDGTIIKTKSGNVFPKNKDDWQIIYPEVPAKLKRLHNDGYKICFFTNQAGIGRGKVKLDDFKQKVQAILNKLGVPVQVFISTCDGYYRKPLPGMWEHLVEAKNNGVQLKLEKCFYVGDAAGRPESGTGVGKRRKDHSLVDRLFAKNIGVSFYTPEEHFLGKHAEQWNKPEFDPSSVHERVPQFEPEAIKIPGDNCEMIIMVGLPGSGKSHFCEETLKTHGYKIINSDTLGGTQACLKACEKAFMVGASCVVDNTNVDVDSRKKFIDLAKRMNALCRCFVMNVSPAHVKHNIIFRELTDTNHSKINEMVLNMMKKKYKAPTLDEGFAEIVKVNLKPKFNSTQHERLYKLYLAEK